MRSVTKILNRVFPMSGHIPKRILETARQRGIAVHDWIEKYNAWKRDGGDKPIIPLEYQIYADYYEEWFEKYEIVPIYEELKLSYADVMDGDEIVEHGLVGVIDMVCDTKDGIRLVSIKSTYAVNIPYCELQESAYNYLLVRNGYFDEPLKAQVLHIHKRGWAYHDLDDRIDTFFKLKEIDDYLLEKGVK